MCLFALSGPLFKIVLGFTPRRRPWKACPSQNDDFLPRFGIHPLQRGLQGRSIPKRLGTTFPRAAGGSAGGEASREAGSRAAGGAWAWAARWSAKQAAGCTLPKPMAAHGHVNGWREGPGWQPPPKPQPAPPQQPPQTYRAPPPKPPPEKPPPPPKEVWPPIPTLAALACWAAEALVME